MLFVCFSESVMGLLKFAIHKYSLDPSQVVCIPDDLSVGIISNIEDFTSRRDTLFTLLRGVGEDYIDVRCKSIYQEFFNEIYNHKEITIWYGNSPFEFCGFLFTNWLLRNEAVTINGIFCSRTIEREPKKYITYKYAGQIHPEDVKQFLSYSKEITDKEKKDYAELWNKLSDENGELRVYKDFTVVTSDISYYDQIIMNHISNIYVHSANIVGKILSDEQLGIGDGLIFERIKELVRQGILKQDGDLIMKISYN